MFMRKSANSAALRERARQLGVRPPSYSIPAAQAEVQTSEGLRQVASEIADQLDSHQCAEHGAEADSRGTASPQKGAPTKAENVDDPSSDASPGLGDSGGPDGRSGRRKAKAKTIYLHI